jgi:glycogen synthase
VYVAGETQHPDGGSLSLPCVIPLGRLKPADLRRWYAKADIYALPALYEPFGLSVLEAALSGCALVLGDIQSLRELWDGAALFVPPEDHESLSVAINCIIETPAIRKELGERAKARALTFSRKRMVNGYLDAYSLAYERHGNTTGVATSCVL